MNLTIAAVGRMKAGAEKSLWDDYAKRLNWSLTLKEVEEKKPLKPAQLKIKEAELLLSAVPKGATLVAMDRGGRELASTDLAKKLGAWQDDGISEIAFVIGGSDGLDQTILDKAQLKIAMGAMTWPHLLARVMLIEQIYRAQCILSNHPYHK
ncbi:MAG: 23S rRNA (pseudouridine(1915)-N(3))-methyltransferase RlmH [Rhodospirillaceae bacterium]|jgi:23S rRNA (pseudouridine1915-N3)-methyltransferase|nr:23S rRNA (pseudouridine(1915)-N(3))-methyltransferase RlmH [Rhodospirillaceae bacterium]